LRELLGELERISNVAADELVERRVAGEVELFVPAPEGGAVAVEEFDLGRFELDAVRGQGGGEIGVVRLRLDRRSGGRVVRRGVGGVGRVLVPEVLLRVGWGLGIAQYRGK
jgi:hypothetical protein